MKIVNALRIRNNLGAVLDELAEKGEPILVSKGREVRAVLITPDQFKKRFLDVQAEDQKQRLLEKIKSLQADSVEQKQSITILRELRGYDS